MTRTAGHPYDLHPSPWPILRAKAAELSQNSPEHDYLVSVLDSVIESDAADQLVGTFWMLDLAVAAAPVRPAPIELILVRGSGSVRPPPSGLVRIEHLSVSGHNDVVDRPPSEALPLFWRFVKEKYGIERWRAGDR